MVIDDNRHSHPPPKSFDFENQNSIPDHRIAHPLDRLASFVLDGAVLFIIASLAIAPFQKKIRMAQMVNETDQIIVAAVLALLVLSVLAIAYQFLMTSWKGGTLGKIAFGTRVVDVWTGRPAKLTDIFVRSVVWWIDTLLVCVPHFGMYSDPLRRPFHDRVANTVVISVSSRKGFAPELSEMSVMKSLFVAMYFLVFILVAIQVKQSYSLINADENADLLSLASPVYCDSVSNAQAQWPLEHNQPANRVSIALALFAAGQIEEECLDQEAYLEFQNGDQHDLAYLARAFATSDDSSLSDKYLERVCEKTKNSEACTLSELISFWTERDWDKATEGFMSSLPESSVFVKTWAIKHFEKVKDYAQEMKVIENLWPLQGLNEFLASHRTVALWGMHRKAEARVSLQSAIELLPKSKQLGLSSWMCFNELESTCAAELPPSCEHFEKLSEESSSVFSHDLYALTLVRIASCKDFDRLSILKTQIEEPRVLKLIEAIENEHDGKIEAAIAIYRDLVDNTEATSPIYQDTFKRVFKIVSDQNREDFFDIALNDWEKSNTPDFWNWYVFGENLSEALIENGHYQDALGIGKQILLKDPYNSEIKKQMVVASYKNKDYRQTARYLKSLDVENENQRMPASIDTIKRIRENMGRLAK